MNLPPKYFTPRGWLVQFFPVYTLKPPQNYPTWIDMIAFAGAPGIFHPFKKYAMIPAMFWSILRKTFCWKNHKQWSTDVHVWIRELNFNPSIYPGQTRFGKNIWTLNGWKNHICSPLESSRKLVFNHHLHHRLFPIHHRLFPIMFFILSCLPLFLPHSLHFRPENSRWEWVRKGNHSVFKSVCLFFSNGSCPLWFLRSAGHLQYP